MTFFAQLSPWARRSSLSDWQTLRSLDVPNETSTVVCYNHLPNRCIVFLHA